MAILTQDNFDDPLELNNSSMCNGDCKHPFHHQNNYFAGGYPNSCCCGCYTASDDFNRAAIGANWVVDFGTWSIISDKLVETAGSGRIIFQKSDTEYHIASTEVHDPELDDIYNVYVGYLDTGNYHRAEFTLDTDNVLLMKLIERIGGSITEGTLQTCSGTWDSTDPVTLTACLGKHVFMAWPSTSYGGVVSTDRHTFIAGGTKAGVGHLNGLGESGVFDDFSYSEHYDSDIDCPNCGFCSCDDDLHNTPALLQLTYIGYDHGCNSCSDLTGYTIDMVPEGGVGDPDPSCNPSAWRATETGWGSCFEPFEHADFNPGDPALFYWFLDCPLSVPGSLENWTLRVTRKKSTGDYNVAVCGFLGAGVDADNNPLNLPPTHDLVPNTGLSTCNPLYLVYNVDYYYCPATGPKDPPPTPPNPGECQYTGILEFPYSSVCPDNCSGCGMVLPVGVCHRVQFDIVVAEKA